MNKGLFALAMFLVSASSQVLPSGVLVLDGQQQVFRDRGFTLSDRLCQAIFQAQENDGWVKLTSPDLVEELSRIPTLLEGVLRVQLTADTLAVFGASVPCWGHLAGIALNFCELKNIPDWLMELPNLKHLSLVGNKGIKISAKDRFPSALEIVELDGCELGCVPQGLAYLKNLRMVGLGFNPRYLALPPWLVERQRRGITEIRGLWF